MIWLLCMAALVGLVTTDPLYFVSQSELDAAGLQDVSSPDDVGSVMCPDHLSTCPLFQTCCIMQNGHYGCCPLTKDAHVTEGVSDTVCPGGHYSCPNGFTCCPTQGGHFGCCPVTKGVCCADHSHCCPHGYTCDGKHGTCTQQDGQVTLPFLSMNIASTRVNTPQSAHQVADMPDTSVVDMTAVMVTNKTRSAVVAMQITCADNVSTCPQDTTCCEMQSGWYGCCPFKDAVCCADRLHCCVSSQTCDNEKRTCVDSATHTQHYQDEQLESSPVVRDDIVCADNVSSCPQSTTCCLMQSGWYGCCPHKDGVCCSDKLHCCGAGETCDEHGDCQSGHSAQDSRPHSIALAQSGHSAQDSRPHSIALAHKLPAQQLMAQVTATWVVCPDGQSMCPDGSSCCILTSGNYGCCPLKQAVCCADHIHCCPHGMTCNPTTGQCASQPGSILMVSQAWEKKTAAVSVSAVTCPDGKSACQDTGHACCKLPSGHYGCCPFKQAVCCSDGVHCCPAQHTCDVTSGTCLTSRDEAENKDVTKDAQLKPQVGDIECPDGKSLCPDGTTCCVMAGGDYGCCPMPDAVCCADHEHCCPSGTKCNTAEQTCSKNGLTWPWTEKVVAKMMPTVLQTSSSPARFVLEEIHPKSKDVHCDNESMCPDGYTCCHGQSHYGCCHHQDAVCCADGNTCCPAGYHCDSTQKNCVKGKPALTFLFRDPALPHIPASQVIVGGANIACADGSTCPDGTTCCKLPGGDYGCCPYKQAVCCSDHTHCCPAGYMCDLARLVCIPPATVGEVYLPAVPMSRKIPALKSLEIQKDVSPINQYIECPDHRSFCYWGQTCCIMPNGWQYGCCPLPNAICCSDHVHCCPKNYICSSGSSCDHYTQPLQHNASVADLMVPILSNKQAEQVANYFQQRKTNTKYMLNHPSQQTNAIKNSVNHHSVSPFMRLQNNTCLDQKSICKVNETCCQISSGSFGCCPYPNGTCCGDYKHCCPSTYTCSTDKQHCIPQHNILGSEFHKLKNVTSKPIRKREAVDSLENKLHS